MIRTVAALACVAALAAGCSSSSSSGLPADTRATLQADVLALSRAAADSNWTSASGALDRLRSDLSAALAGGRISAAQASTIRARISAITADLAAKTAPATAPSTTSRSTSTATTPSPKPKPTQPDDDKHKPGHGHGGDEGDA